MNIDVYKSETTLLKFVCVQAGADVSTALFHSGDPDLRLIAAFKRNVKLEPAHPVVGLNALEVINQITRQGYSVQQLQIHPKLGDT